MARFVIEVAGPYIGRVEVEAESAEAATRDALTKNWRDIVWIKPYAVDCDAYVVEG